MGKGGLDFNMPHMKMPKFGFGGKGNKTDADIDFDGNVSLPSNEGKHHDGEIKVTTPEIKTSVDTPNVDADGKGSGGIDFNMPKFGFGGHKGSKKKKKDKKKKDKHASDSDSDSDDEHKHKKCGLQTGIDGGVKHEVKVDKTDVDVNVN